MADYKAITLALLDQRGIRYNELEDGVIRLGYTADYIKDLKIFLFFDRDGDNYVQLRSGVLGNYRDEKLAAGLALVNRLNGTYRWAKFVIDEDQDLEVRCDAILAVENAGETVHELIGRLVGIIDEAYPEIMRSIWA